MNLSPQFPVLIIQHYFSIYVVTLLLNSFHEDQFVHSSLLTTSIILAHGHHYINMYQINEWEKEWMNPGYLGLKNSYFHYLTNQNCDQVSQVYFYSIYSLCTLYSDCSYFGGLNSSCLASVFSLLVGLSNGWKQFLTPLYSFHTFRIFITCSRWHSYSIYFVMAH